MANDKGKCSECNDDSDCEVTGPSTVKVYPLSANKSLTTETPDSSEEDVSPPSLHGCVDRDGKKFATQHEARYIDRCNICGCHDGHLTEPGNQKQMCKLKDCSLNICEGNEGAWHKEGEKYVPKGSYQTCTCMGGGGGQPDHSHSRRFERHTTHNKQHTHNTQHTTHNEQPQDTTNNTQQIHNTEHTPAQDNKGKHKQTTKGKQSPPLKTRSKS